MNKIEQYQNTTKTNALNNTNNVTATPTPINNINANAVDNKNTKNGDTITIFNHEVKKSTAIIAGIIALGATIAAIFAGKHFFFNGNKAANEASSAIGENGKPNIAEKEDSLDDLFGTQEKDPINKVLDNLDEGDTQQLDDIAQQTGESDKIIPQNDKPDASIEQSVEDVQNQSTQAPVIEKTETQDASVQQTNDIAKPDIQTPENKASEQTPSDASIAAEANDIQANGDDINSLTDAQKGSITEESAQASDIAETSDIEAASGGSIIAETQLPDGTVVTLTDKEMEKILQEAAETASQTGKAEMLSDEEIQRLINGNADDISSTGTLSEEEIQRFLDENADDISAAGTLSEEEMEKILKESQQISEEINSQTGEIAAISANSAAAEAQKTTVTQEEINEAIDNAIDNRIAPSIGKKDTAPTGGMQSPEAAQHNSDAIQDLKNNQVENPFSSTKVDPGQQADESYKIQYTQDINSQNAADLIADEEIAAEIGKKDITPTGGKDSIEEIHDNSDAIQDLKNNQGENPFASTKVDPGNNADKSSDDINDTTYGIEKFIQDIQSEREAEQAAKILKEDPIFIDAEYGIISRDIVLKNGQAFYPPLDNGNLTPFEGRMEVIKNGKKYELIFDKNGKIVQSKIDGQLAKEYSSGINYSGMLETDIVNHTNNEVTHIFETPEVNEIPHSKYYSTFALKDGQPVRYKRGHETIITKDNVIINDENAENMVTRHRMFDKNTHKLVQEGFLEKPGLTEMIAVKDGNLSYSFPALSVKRAIVPINQKYNSLSDVKYASVKENLPNGVVKRFYPAKPNYTMLFPDGGEFGLEYVADDAYPRFFIDEKINRHIGSITGKIYPEKDGFGKTYFSSVVANNHQCKTEKEKQAMLEIFKAISPDKSVSKNLPELDITNTTTDINSFNLGCITEESIQKAMDSIPFEYDSKLVKAFKKMRKKYGI